MRVIGEKFVRFGKVDEGSDSCQEQRIEFLFGLFLLDLGGSERAVGELACDEVGCGPVRVWDGALAVTEGFRRVCEGASPAWWTYLSG